ncbi:MAG: spore coat associated protein CotJA [Acutalibacteraceae bacterium]
MNDFIKDTLISQYGISPLPNDPVVAMAYVPFQVADSVYSAEQGLASGTMFPELNKPFEGETVEGNVNE